MCIFAVLLSIITVCQDSATFISVFHFWNFLSDWPKIGALCTHKCFVALKTLVANIGTWHTGLLMSHELPAWRTHCAVGCASSLCRAISFLCGISSCAGAVTASQRAHKHPAPAFFLFWWRLGLGQGPGLAQKSCPNLFILKIFQ